MQLMQKSTIATLLFCGLISHAKVEYYAAAQVNDSYIGFGNKLKLIPGSIQALSFWTDQDTISQYRGAQIELQGAWPLESDKGIIASVDYATINKNTKTLGMGSYELTVQHMFGLSAGGYYQTQSGSQLSASLKVTAPKVELGSTANGLLFNGSVPKATEEFTPLVLQIQAKISVPVTTAIDAYLSTGYSLGNYGVELDLDPDFPACNNFALVEQSANAIPLGNQISQSPRILLNSISFGIRTHIYTQR